MLTTGKSVQEAKVEPSAGANVSHKGWGGMGRQKQLTRKWVRISRKGKGKPSARKGVCACA